MTGERLCSTVRLGGSTFLFMYEDGQKCYQLTCWSVSHTGGTMAAECLQEAQRYWDTCHEYLTYMFGAYKKEETDLYRCQPDAPPRFWLPQTMRLDSKESTLWQNRVRMAEWYAYPGTRRWDLLRLWLLMGTNTFTVCVTVTGNPNDL